jgi:hypothetical protein
LRRLPLIVFCIEKLFGAKYVSARLYGSFRGGPAGTNTQKGSSPLANRAEKVLFIHVSWCECGFTCVEVRFKLGDNKLLVEKWKEGLKRLDLRS